MATPELIAIREAFARTKAREAADKLAVRFGLAPVKEVPAEVLATGDKELIRETELANYAEFMERLIVVTGLGTA